MTTSDKGTTAISVEVKDLEERILANRGMISPLYRMLLTSPPVADGWERLLTAIRQHSALPAHLRELVILRVAVLNKADYEFQAHLPHARTAGLSASQLDAIRTADSSGYSANERLVIEYTDAMTRDVHVGDGLFERIRAAFDPVTRVELTATIAAYNMVSRFLVALRVH